MLSGPRDATPAPLQSTIRYASNALTRVARHVPLRARSEAAAGRASRPRAGRSLALQLQFLVRRREGPAGDEPEPRLRHARPLCVDEAELPDRRVHRLVVNEL